MQVKATFIFLKLDILARHAECVLEGVSDGEIQAEASEPVSHATRLAQ